VRQPRAVLRTIRSPPDVGLRARRVQLILGNISKQLPPVECHPLLRRELQAGGYPYFFYGDACLIERRAEGGARETAVLARLHMALSSLPACSGTISQTPTAVATMKTGIVREARAKEPVACCSRDGGERPQHKSDEEADEPHDAIGDTPNAVARGWHRNRRFADSPLEGGVSCELVSEVKFASRAPMGRFHGDWERFLVP